MRSARSAPKGWPRRSAPHEDLDVDDGDVGAVVLREARGRFRFTLARRRPAGHRPAWPPSATPEPGWSDESDWRSGGLE